MMKRYKRILVPVDGSDLSKLAFENALSLAQMVDGNITVLHVTEPIFIRPSPLNNISLAAQAVEKENKNRIESILKSLKEQGVEEDVTVETKITSGNISDEILKASSDFDLIIMGSLGQSALTKLFLGSVAEKVSRHACCPVMLVRKHEKNCDKEGSNDENLTDKLKKKMDLDSDLN
jgi:nucleotide-binding universal stress UspA family protein